MGIGLDLAAGKSFFITRKGKIWVESSGKNKGSTFYKKINEGRECIKFFM